MSYIPKFGRLWVTPQIKIKNRLYAILRYKALSLRQFVSVQTVGKQCRSRGGLSANIYDFFVGASTNVSRLPLDSRTTLGAATRTGADWEQWFVFNSKAFGPADPSESFLISQLPTFATVLIVEDVCIVESHFRGASLPKGFGRWPFYPFRD
jgi:hypothetical protein